MLQPNQTQGCVVLVMLVMLVMLVHPARWHDSERAPI
jgi:hypothetical protein